MKSFIFNTGLIFLFLFPKTHFSQGVLWMERNTLECVFQTDVYEHWVKVDYQKKKLYCYILTADNHGIYIVDHFSQDKISDTAFIP